MGPRWGPNPLKRAPRGAPKQKITKKEARWDNKPSWVNVPYPLGPHFGGPRAPKRGPRPSQERPKRCPERSKSGFQKRSHFRIVFLRFFGGFSSIFFDVFWSHFVDISVAMLLPLIYENIDFYMCFCSRNWFPTFYGESSLKHFSDKNGWQFGIDFWSIFSIDFGMDFGTKNR